MASLHLLGRKSHVSQRGLAAVLKEIRENDIPDATSRTSIKRSRDAALMVSEKYGPLWQDLPLTMVDPKIKKAAR